VVITAWFAEPKPASLRCPVNWKSVGVVPLSAPPCRGQVACRRRAGSTVARRYYPMRGSSSCWSRDGRRANSIAPKRCTGQLVCRKQKGSHELCCPNGG
jgi:hypothetical protein